MPHITEVPGVRRAWLQDGEGPMRPVVDNIPDQHGSNNEISLPANKVNLLRRYRALFPKQRKAAQEYYRTAAGSGWEIEEKTVFSGFTRTG